MMYSQLAVVLGSPEEQRLANEKKTVMKKMGQQELLLEMKVSLDVGGRGASVSIKAHEPEVGGGLDGAGPRAGERMQDWRVTRRTMRSSRNQH